MKDVIRETALPMTVVMSALTLCAQLSAAPYPEASKEIHVALTGDDRNPGTAQAPLRSLTAARDAVRGIRQAHPALDGAVVVSVQAGTYELSEALVLDRRDSGTPSSPTVYRATPGERVRLCGGSCIPPAVWKPVGDEATRARLAPAARNEVRQVDLRALGVTDFGKRKSRGFGRGGGPVELELFFDGRPMRTARYPDSGWLKTKSAPDGPDGGRFTVQDTTVAGWNESDDLWVHGYWKHDWADTYEHVAGLSITSNVTTVVTHPPHGAYGYHGGKRFYFLNALEALDAPGEWHLATDSGVLHFWPPADLKSGEARVSIAPGLVSARDTSHVVIEGFTLDTCRGNAIDMNGGRGNLVRRCTFSNIGQRAVRLTSTMQSGVESCHISETGEGGIYLSGGDRKTLTPAGLFAVGNEFHDFSRRCRTYRAAIQVSGVGNRVTHNHIHHGPHMGIGFSGNDHVIEFNEIHNVCAETDDVGAIYAGRDWTMRGHIIRHNYFHDIYGPVNHIGAMSVYLDDTLGGVSIYGNVFVRAARAAFLGGGRDITVENNIFVDCHPSVHLDARAMGWAARRGCIKPDGAGTWGILGRLKAVAYDRPPYREKYPHLANILEDDPVRPKYNVIRNNLSIGGKWLDMATEAEGYNTVTNNLIKTADAGYLEMEEDTLLSIRHKAITAELPEFKPIPFNEIGPRAPIGAWK